MFKKSVPAGKFNFGSNNYMNWPMRAFVDHFILIVLPHKPIVGINDNTDSTQELSVSVFPNPTSNHVTLDMGKEYEFAEINVLDFFGNSIKQTNCRDCRNVNMEIEAPAGTYFLRIKTGNQTVLSRFIKLD